MLIVLGGLLGSGRRVLAQKLALKYGLYHYNIDSKKLRDPSLGFDGEGNFKILQPKTDEDQLRVYEQVLEDFPLLSKMHANAIVDDSFHRETPREYFLSGARKYYKEVIFVWVESDEASVGERLEHMQKLGMIRSVAEATQRRRSAIETLQLPASSVLRFFFSTSGKKQVAAVWELIQQRMNPKEIKT